jgi:hypothetical protein
VWGPPSESNAVSARMPTRLKSEWVQAVRKLAAAVVLLPNRRGEVMQGFVLGADRQQPTLLPECLEDRVDESNSIRAVDVFAEALETPRPRVRWRPVGQRTILPNYGDSALNSCLNQLDRCVFSSISPSTSFSTVVTTVCLLPLHTGRGCNGHPAFRAPLLNGRAAPSWVAPRPSPGERLQPKLGRIVPRALACVCACDVMRK